MVKPILLRATLLHLIVIAFSTLLYSCGSDNGPLPGSGKIIHFKMVGLAIRGMDYHCGNVASYVTTSDLVICPRHSVIRFALGDVTLVSINANTLLSKAHPVESLADGKVDTLYEFYPLQLFPGASFDIVKDTLGTQSLPLDTSTPNTQVINFYRLVYALDDDTEDGAHLVTISNTSKILLTDLDAIANFTAPLNDFNGDELFSQFPTQPVLPGPGQIQDLLRDQFRTLFAGLYHLQLREGHFDTSLRDGAQLAHLMLLTNRSGNVLGAGQWLQASDDTSNMGSGAFDYWQDVSLSNANMDRAGNLNQAQLSNTVQLETNSDFFTTTIGSWSNDTLIGSTNISPNHRVEPIAANTLSTLLGSGLEYELSLKVIPCDTQFINRFSDGFACTSNPAFEQRWNLTVTAQADGNVYLCDGTPIGVMSNIQDTDDDAPTRPSFTLQLLLPDGSLIDGLQIPLAAPYSFSGTWENPIESLRILHNLQHLGIRSQEIDSAAVDVIDLLNVQHFAIGTVSGDIGSCP